MMDMDRQTAICVLFGLLLTVAVCCWSVVTSDWQRAEATMFDGYSPAARAAGEANGEWRMANGNGEATAVPPLHPSGEGAGGEVHGRHLAHARDAHATSGEATAVPPLHPSGEGAGGEVH